MPYFLHFPEVRVVEASAGSGKTWALARRYVQLVLHLSRGGRVPPIHTILAITFTNKAAFEMKERILKFLKQIALGVMAPADLADMLTPLGMTPGEGALTARRVIEAVLRNYNYFQVETIDKFINALLVSSAFQIGLTADFRIRTDPREALAFALDELIDEASSDPRVRGAFDDFLTSMLLVEARSSWMPRDVVLDTVTEMFREYNTRARGFSGGGVTPGDIIRVKAGVVADIRALSERMPEGTNATFVKSVAGFLGSRRSAFHFKNLSASFQAGKGLPVNKTARPESWHFDQWDRIQKGLVQAARLEVEHLYDPYIGLFERVRAHLTEACRRDDIVFLGELNARARLVYEEGIAPEELYYRLAARFEHYLLDEFQDTSLLQWENLKALPEDGIAKGGSIFYVGDKKQAIYSFRGGDTRLFDHVRARFSDPGYHPALERLERNFRSHAGIVAFNNKVFSVGNLERFLRVADDEGERRIPARPGDEEELRRVYAGSAQAAVNREPEGVVRFEVLSGGKKEDYAKDARDRVTALLKGLRGRFAWSDIAVLVRKNNEVEEVSRWLLEAKIPAASDRTLSVKENGRVREVAAFLRFLVSPVDNEAFACFILGGMFRAVSGMSEGELQDFVLSWSCQRREGGPAHLYAAFRGAFPGAWGLLEEFFRKVGLCPLYELLVSFYRRMNVAGAFPGDHGFLMRFLELVKSREEDFISIDDFLVWYEALEGEEVFVRVIAENAVRVMTVHKAKGLEFPVVILPFLGMSLSRSSPGESKALNYTLRAEEGGLRLYHFTSAHLGYSQLAGELALEETMSLFFGELNNLYVALTRPAFELYGFLPPRVKNGRNLALDLIPEEARQSGAPAPDYPRKAKDDEGTPKEVLPSACRDWISYLEEEFGDAGDLALREERARGVALHAVLGRLGRLSEGSWRAALRDAVRQTRALGELLLQEDECRRLLEMFLTAERVRPFFFRLSPGLPRHNRVGSTYAVMAGGGAVEVFCEKEFANRFGDTKRMDRVLVFRDEVWVVDFKTSVFTDDGREQVRQYQKILTDVYPGKKARGFLASLDNGVVEEVE